MSGGLTAAGLLVLFLALIGAGVGVYYAYICLQARPLRSKKPKDAEHGPLIPPDPDVNGNHEDVPVEASAPLHDNVDVDSKLHPDLPGQSSSPQDPKGADSPEPSKSKEDVLILVEDDVPPAKVTHEKETVPVVNHVAPLGFVLPSSVAPSQETPLDHHPVPRNLKSQPQPQPQPQSPQVESPPSSNTPVPVYIPPPPPQKKPIAISDEEDGLLLQEPPHPDDCLSPELCATLPVSRSPLKNLREEPTATSQNNPPGNPPQPEGIASVAPARQPPAAVPEVDHPHECGSQPVVGVVPFLPPRCPEKDEMKSVKKAPDALPPENCNKPAAVYWKDDEHFPISETSKTLNNEVPAPMTDAIPAAVPISPEAVSKDFVNEETCVDSDDFLTTDRPLESIEAPPESIESRETAENSPDNKREPTPEGKEVDKDTRSNASCSVSSEKPELPHHAPTSTEATLPVGAESDVSVESSRPQPMEDEEAVTGDIPTSPPAASDSASPLVNTLKEDFLNIPEKDPAPDVTVHSPADEAEPLSDASSDVSDAVCEDVDIPTEAPSTPPTAEMSPGNKASVTASQPPADVPISTCSVPLEAYNSLSGDPSDEDIPLPMIREEGSGDNNSEGIDTDSSEPEVTDYSFSSGPSAPSTTGVLANEISCTLEPKVTKITTITDMNASESEDSEISDEDLEEDDLASPSEDSDEEILDNRDTSVKSMTITEGKQACITEQSIAISDFPDISKQNAAPDGKPDDSPTEAAANDAPVSAPDSGSKIPGKAAVDSCDSETESEGAEAEVELREEMVIIPAVVCDKTNSNSTGSPTPPSGNHAGIPVKTCPPKPQLFKASQGNGSSLEEIPSATDDDGLSISTPESCDLSDGEVTTSTPKKSMIPRLVKHSEA